MATCVSCLADALITRTQTVHTFTVFTHRSIIDIETSTLMVAMARPSILTRILILKMLLFCFPNYFVVTCNNRFMRYFVLVGASSCELGAWEREKER